MSVSPDRSRRGTALQRPALIVPIARMRVLSAVRLFLITNITRARSSCIGNMGSAPRRSSAALACSAARGRIVLFISEMSHSDSLLHRRIEIASGRVSCSVNASHKSQSIAISRPSTDTSHPSLQSIITSSRSEGTILISHPQPVWILLSPIESVSSFTRGSLLASQSLRPNVLPQQCARLLVYPKLDRLL